MMGTWCSTGRERSDADEAGAMPGVQASLCSAMNLVSLGLLLWRCKESERKERKKEVESDG